MNIDIKCVAADELDIDDLTEFQGNLKKRNDADIEKITKSIKKHGFSFPFFVWPHDGINHVFDGHGRLLALKRMRAQGVEIPPLPVSYIDADNEAEAKELLLKLNSQYGSMSTESVAEFLDDIEIDFSDIALPAGYLSFIDEDDVSDFDFPDLKSGDRDSMCTMTFTLTEEQKKDIESALQSCGRFETEENPNENGNALAKIVGEWMSWK